MAYNKTVRRVWPLDAPTLTVDCGILMLGTGGENETLPAPAAHATASYTRGKARIDLEITDTGGHPDYVGSLAKVAGSTFNQKASNGYLKGTTIGGHPATESWNHVDKLGDVSVLIARRMIVHATGTGLSGIETLRSLVEKVDPAKLNK